MIYLQVTDVAATTEEATEAPVAEESEEGPSEVAKEGEAESEAAPEEEATESPAESEPSE